MELERFKKSCRFRVNQGELWWSRIIRKSAFVGSVNCWECLGVRTALKPVVSGNSQREDHHDDNGDAKWIL